MGATAVQLPPWIKSVPLATWVSIAALTVSLGALAVSCRSADIANKQAELSQRQDLRTELSEVESSLLQIGAARSALRMEVDSARSIAGSQRWAPPQAELDLGPLREMADRAVRSGYYASVVLTEEERSLWSEIQARSRLLHTVLTEPRLNMEPSNEAGRTRQRAVVNTAADRLWELAKELEKSLERGRRVLDDRHKQVMQRLAKI